VAAPVYQAQQFFKPPAIPDVAVKANGQVMFCRALHDDISFGLWHRERQRRRVDAVFGAINS
jgi:hypothetical protein